MACIDVYKNNKATVGASLIIVCALLIYMWISHSEFSKFRIHYGTKDTTSQGYEGARHFENKPDMLTGHKRQHVIFCMIFTTPEQWHRKALAVKLTWATRCDIYAFFYSKRDGISLDGAYALNVDEGRDHLTGKSMEAFRVSFSKYSQQVDWYLKADDDTYVIMENLRRYLHDYNSSKAYYFGHTSHDFLRKGYNSGGAGYVLSSAAARALVENGDQFADSCPVDGAIEDLDIGRCLEALRIYPTDTRDKEQRVRFHPDHPLKLLLGEHDALGVYQYSKDNYTFGHPQGIKVMSDEMISFHYMEPGHIYMYDFLLYGLKRNQPD